MVNIDIIDSELVWPDKYDQSGKLHDISRVNLPFQIIETINQSTIARQAKKHAGTQRTLFDIWQGDEGQTFETGWKNKLIWGENKYVISSLLEKFAGRINLIYIDPPFATGADFSFQTEIGEQDITKSPSTVEMKVYNDTWGKGLSSYTGMIYDRLTLMKELLSVNGSLYVHLDSRVSHYVKLILDEIFGRENFRNEIVWKRTFAHGSADRWGDVHDTILFYTKSDDYIWTDYTIPLESSYLDDHYYSRDEKGRYQYVVLTGPGTSSGDSGKEWRGYNPTSIGRHWAVPQKALEQLRNEGIKIPDNIQEQLELLYKKGFIKFSEKKGGKIGTPRFKSYASDKGAPLQGLILDVPPINSQAQERLGFPTQKPEALLDRIIRASSNPGDLVVDFFCGSGTTLAAAEKLGRRWIGCDISRFAIHTTRKRLLEIEKCKPFEILNLGKYERQIWQSTSFSGTDDQTVLYQYLAFILKLYKAEPFPGFQFIHGRKGKALVHVGAVDSPVTIDEISSAISECVSTKQSELHVLGWEWEMGLHDLIEVEAKRQGVKLRLLVIPNEITQADIPQKDDIKFYDLAYIQARVKANNKIVEVELQDFMIPNTELIPDDVKVKHWSDLVDYWAIDFDFRNDTFMNHWSSYRTYDKPKLDLKSDRHECKKSGRYNVVVKVVDVFGIDSSRYYEIDV